MIEKGKPLSLSSFIDVYKTNDVFTGKYYGKILKDSDQSVQKDFEQVRRDIESNNMLKQLMDMENTVKQMGLAVQVYPQTNSKDKTVIGYELVVYDPKNKDKVLGDKGEYKDAKGDYSFGKFVNVSFADSVKLGHSGINNYTDVLDSNKNRIVRLKQNEAQLKVFNDKLHIMQGKFKSKGGEALRYVKSASHFADEEMKSVELKTKSNLQDKDDDTYRSGSQILDAQLAEKVNISPLLTQMKWAYGIDEKYNKKVMELLSLVSHAKDEADALKYINAREKDLKRGIKKYDGFKQAMLSVQKSGIEYDYGNTSETAYSTYKSATFNRNLIAGDVLLSPVLREQGRKNTHNLSNDEAERKRQIESLGIVRGILASRTGEAKSVTYAGDIVNERNELAYDAAVKAIELSDKELAEKGKANLTVREGQSIVSGEYAKLLDTSHHTMNRTFSKKDMEEVKAEFDELSKKKLSNKKLSKKKLDKLDELSPLFNEDGSMKEKEVATYLFTKFLERSKMSLFKPEAGTSDLSNVNIFKNDKGGYTVSGEGRVKFENGRRGTDTIGNMRSEMVEDDQAFDDLHLTKANGEDAGSLASHHIQVIAGREQLDSRKYGTRMKQDLTSTLMDMRSLDKLNDFFAQLRKDVDSTDEIKKNSAEFFSSILELSQDGKVYISDDIKKVNGFFEGKDKKQLSGYLAYLDQLRDLFGGNEGLGRVYSLDKDGNLVRTGNARTFYTNLGGDDNVQYGDYSNLGAVDFRTGHDSMTRALRMAVSQMTEDEKKAYRSGNKDVYDVAEDISSQFDAAKKDKEELERLKQSNKESVANMRKTVTQGISVKDLNKGLDEQKYITVGKGKDYDVDIDAAKMEVRDENNEVINKEETLTAMIDKKREEVAEARKKAKIKAMEAELSEIKDKEEKEKKRAEIEAFKKAKADESDLQVVIDTQGVQFGKNVTYGDKTYGYQGKAIYLDRDNGSLKGYQERGYAGEINNGLVNALQSGDVSGIEKAAETVVEKAINSVNYKEGSDFQRLLKKKMPHSISGHTSAVNMANIMTQEEYDEEKKKQAKLGESGNADYRKLLFSDINSFGVQLSKEVVENYLKAKKPDDSKQDEYSDEDLRKMLLGFGLDKKEDVEKMGRDKIIDLILDTLTIDMKDTSRWSRAYKSGKLQNGLSAVAGRFPFMSGLDLDALTKVFIGKDVQGNQIKVGAGLAKKENADYDGDHENLKFMKLSGGEDVLFNKAAGMREDVLRKLSWIAKREGEQNDAEMQVFDDDYYKGVSSDLVKQSALLAGRRNKGATGVFSNFATQIRNTMRDIGFDETNMGHGTKEETENAATAIIVRSYFEAMEQDMISSKKVIKRIVQETGEKEENITEDFIREYQKNILESVDGIIQQFYDGTITFDDLNKKLASMEIFKTENGKIALNNRVTQSGLLSIEELEGGKDFLRKISNGKYREYAMYGKATDEDVAFAQSFAEEGKGGFEAWSKTDKADALRKKLAAAGVNYDNRDKDLYDMLLSGKVHEEDYGTVNQDMFMSSMGLITQYAQAHKEAGIDGDPDSFLRTAKNKTHSPDKKNVENNPYHASNVPFTEAEKAAAEKMNENNANAMFGNAAAISDLSTELADASGDIGKALAAILKYIINFSKGTIAVGNGIMNDTAGAKFLKESKFFKAPFSTTSVTGTVSPYEGISGDPALVDKIIANKNKKYLGYGSIEELRRNVGSGDAAVAALRGHVVGERTQFMQSLKEIARDKGWKGSENALIRKFKKNLESLRAETDSSVQQTVSFYDAFQKDEGKYLEFLEAIHGKKGYDDKDFFLKKQHYESYRDILKNAYLAQSKSLEVFFSPDKMAELDGKKAKTINEDIFVGAADTSNDANFVGRTDISGLIKQKVKNLGGSEGFKNVLALVDQKTKYGKKLSPADILQGIMNAFAANEDIKLAKSYGNGDFAGWINNPAIVAAQERAKQAGLNIDWQQKFNTLLNADEAQSFIQKTNPKTGETSFVSIDDLFPTLQSKVVMAQVAKMMKGELPQQELIKLINSRVSDLADAGINIEGVDNEAIYANATEDEVAQSYLNLSKRKLELEEQQKELQYQINDDTVEKNDTDIKVLEDKLKQVNEELDKTEKDIQEAADTGARLKKFKKKVVDKNKPGAAETTKEVDVEEELKKEKESQDLKYEQFTGSEQKQATIKLSSTLERMIQLRKGMKERDVRSNAAGVQGISKEQQLVNQLANEKDQKEYDELANSLKGVDWETSVGGAEALAKVLDDASKSANLADQQVAALNSDLNPTIWKQMTNSVKGWFSQLMRGQLVWKILGQVQRALGAVIEDAKKLDAVLVNLQIVTGDTRENTRNLISTYASLAQTMSSTTSEVASAANDWLRQGYSISESIDLITASLQLSKLGMIDSGRATSYLTSMLKGFKLEASDATTVVDKLTKVDMSAATSAGDIAEALRQFATTAQLSGVDLDESIAMATTIMDVSQKDASSTGNAIKTMLSRFGNVKAGIYSGMNITGDQNETTESLNDIDKVLKKLGISLRSSNLEFRDFDDVLDDIAAKWETLDSVSKNAIATAMAGTRQRESFLVLMENYDKYKDFIEEAANSEGTAAEKYKAYEDSLEASQKKLSAALEELASKTEVVDFFKTINKLGTEIIKWMPTIFRYLVAFTSGKAFNRILRLLSASGSFNLSFNGLKKGAASLISGGYISQHLGLEEVGKSTVGRTGLIDSAIINGTRPIYQELQKSFVASHTVEPQLADGTKLSDIKPHTGTKNFGKNKGEKYTYYTAKGHKGRISEKDYKALVQQKADKVSRAAGSVASGAMSFVTADTTNSHYNQFTGKFEENETNDMGAKIAMKSTSALLTGLGTYFLGPLGGMLGQLGADLFNKHVMGLFFPALQKENANRDRRNKAEDTKKKVEESSSYVSAVTELASKADLTSDDYKKLLEAQQEMRDFLLKPENSEIKEDFERYVRKIIQNQEEGNGLAGKTFAQLTQLTDMTASDRQKAAYAMELAQLKQENAASLNDYEATLYDYYDSVDKGMSEIREKILYGGKGREIATAMGEDYDAIYNENYKNIEHDKSITQDISDKQVKRDIEIEARDMTNSTVYRILKEEFGNEGINGRIAYLEEMAKNDSLSTDVKSQFEIVIKHLQNIADTQEAIHKTVEKQRISEGIYEMSVGKNADGSAKTLLDMSPAALQNMGLDEIVYRMAEYLEKTYGGMLDGTSYFYTDENGKSQVKSTARKDIISGLKSSSEDIYNVIVGKNYTLSDVFGMKDGETKTQMLNNFANALSVPVDQLQSVADAFGNFTLGDVSLSAEDLLAKLQSMETAIGNIASGTQTWATTLQTIIKNYPELIGYATDEYTISLAMFQKMDSFKQLMTNAQFEDIISNETYFKEFSQRLTDNLTEKEKKEFDDLKLTTVKDVMTYVSNNDTDLAKKVGGLLRKEMENITLSSEIQMQLAEKLVAIKSAQLDKEIDNLTSQKEALQDINSQREYENKLIEAKLKLEEATKEKKRVWREGVGWVYEEDQAAISEAKDNLESISNEKAISALTQQIDQLNADKENLNSILSDQEEAVQEGFLKAFGEFDGITNGSLESFGASIQSFIKTSDESAADRFDQWMNVYNSDRAQGITDLKTAWDNLTKAKKEKDRTDLTEEQKKIATENYNTALGEFQKQYGAGVKRGYWSEKDLEKGGSLYGKFGEDNEASKAALGGAGWGQAAYDESLYVKDEDGKWKKFKYNSNKNTVEISDEDWNRFFDKNNGGANFYNQNIGDNENGHRVWAKDDSENAVGRFIYENAQKDPTIHGFTRWMSQNFRGYSMVKLRNGSWYRLTGDSIRKIDNPEIVSENEVPEDVRAVGGKFRKGTLDVSKGNRIPLLMNEEGSEAVVTPNGTITALPTHSGIVPADITSNLWNLGNYAPDLLSALQRQAMLGMNVPGMANNDNSVDNSVSINTVQMTVDADNSFNVDSFVQQLQQVAALTRNNRH